MRDEGEIEKGDDRSRRLRLHGDLAPPPRKPSHQAKAGGEEWDGRWFWHAGGSAVVNGAAQVAKLALIISRPGERDGSIAGRCKRDPIDRRREGDRVPCLYNKLQCLPWRNAGWRVEGWNGATPVAK